MRRGEVTRRGEEKQIGCDRIDRTYFAEKHFALGERNVGQAVQVGPVENRPKVGFGSEDCGLRSDETIVGARIGIPILRIEFAETCIEEGPDSTDQCKGEPLRCEGLRRSAAFH